jgi:hypothetical protein
VKKGTNIYQFQTNTLKQKVMSLQTAPNVTRFDLYRLKKALKSMPISGVYGLATEFHVTIPYETNSVVSTVEGLLNALNVNQQYALLKKYGDAGKPSTYLYMCREKIPDPAQIYNKAKNLESIKHEASQQENYPYFYQVETDDNALKLRFYYFQWSIMVVDEDDNEREIRPKYYGVAIYRKGSYLLEVRTKHKGMANKIATNTPVQLGLESFPSISLMDTKIVNSFVTWVQSLNSANIELPSTEKIAAVRMTARKGTNLRTIAKFTKELSDGQLQGGHITITNGETNINFRIKFRDCHITYTLFTGEPDITCVINVIEKIMGEYTFDKPQKLLKEFFNKQD